MLPVTVLREAARGFDLDGSHARVLSRQFGKVCLAVHDRAGRRVQLRLVRETPDTVARLTAEARWLTHLGITHRLPVPIPRPWCGAVPTSPVLPAPDGTAWRGVAFRWVPGRHLELGLDARAMRDAGALLARLHLANRDAPPDLAGTRPTWWIPRLFELATTLRDVIHGHGDARGLLPRAMIEALREAHDALQRAHDALPAGPEHCGLIHTDAHQRNLRWTQGGVGLVDFEDFANGRFMFDVACICNATAAHRNAPHLHDALLRGYAGVRALPPGFERDLRVMRAFRRFDFAGWVLSWPRPDLHAWGPSFLAGTPAEIARLLG